MWHNEAERAAAGSLCALPANAVTPDVTLPKYSPSAGWCYCNASTSSQEWFTWCEPPVAYPTQINLLALNESAVVVNFVTADDGVRARADVVAELRQKGSGNNRAVQSFHGFSTVYSGSTSHRQLSYHHVVLHSLAPRTEFEYRVRVAESSSAPPSAWSSWLSFRSLYGDGPTRFAAYGDMGVFANIEASPAVPAVSRHNIGNLVDDWASGRIDVR